MLVKIIATSLMSLIATADDCNGGCQAGIRAGATILGSVIGGLITLAGRRREEISEEEAIKQVEKIANEGLCTAVNGHFQAEHMVDFALQLMRTGDNGGKMTDLANGIATWCQQTAAESRRRLGTMNVEQDFRAWSESLETRRLAGKDMSADLPAHMYSQCAGYAFAVGKLAAGGNEDGAIIFGASSKGSSNEKTHGCEAVVKNVNQELLAGNVKGLSVTEDDFGEKIIVATTDLGGLASAVTLATGGLVYKLMHLCKYYN